MTLFWWRKLAKTFFKCGKKATFYVFAPKVFLAFLDENKSFLKQFFLSKCLELKALSTLKISRKSKNLFVRRDRDPVEIPDSFLRDKILALLLEN